MGLIKAALGAAGGVLADQWKEYFYCEAIPSDVLAVKGRKKATGRSSNKHGDDNIITNGSVIAIADGQCMLIVEQGKVVDVCAEPGEYTYDMGTACIHAAYCAMIVSMHQRYCSTTALRCVIVNPFFIFCIVSFLSFKCVVLRLRPQFP